MINKKDCIFIETEPVIGYPRYAADSDKKYIKHVVCKGSKYIEGSNQHRVKWIDNGPTCSDPYCIMNKRNST